MRGNSSQREYIEGEAAGRGLKNLRFVTADMNAFDPGEQFDRVVSVEMFEHMMNRRELLMRVRSWLKPDGCFFMHVFTHRSGTCLFDRGDREDWIAQHFFTGGVMPSHHLIRQYADRWRQRVGRKSLPDEAGRFGFRFVPRHGTYRHNPVTSAKAVFSQLVSSM